MGSSSLAGHGDEPATFAAPGRSVRLGALEMRRKVIMKRRYYVETYDYGLGRFTPQKGVRKGPYTLWGLKRALRKLQDLGYMCCKGDPSVSVWFEER